MSAQRYAVLLSLLVVLSLLASCAPATPQVVEKVVKETVVVEKEVEKAVVETVVVEKEVEKEVIVEKEVPIEKQTVIISYNRFFNMSFGPGPAPIDLIRQEVAKKYPEIDIQINLTPDNMNQWHDAMAIWITAQDATVDLYGMDLPWVSEFGAAGWAVPLNDYLPDIEQKFEKAGLDLYTYEGQLLAIPFWNGTTGLYYRTDLLEEYGFDPPETYDDLVEIAETITADQPEMTGFLWSGDKQESLVMVWSEFLYGFGGQYWNEDGSCAFNSPEGVAAVEFMKETIDTGLSPEETIASGNDEARTRFVEGNAIFFRGPHDYITWLNDPEKSAIVDKWDFMPNPAQSGGRHSGSTGGFGMAVQPYTDNMDAAFKVMEVIASEEVQKGFAIAWGPVQYYQGVYDDPAVKEVYPEAYRLDAVLESSLPRPPSARYAELSTIIQDEVHAAITGIKPAQQALDDACDRVAAME
jgi:multiple sugar transport system substrate-binding protein